MEAAAALLVVHRLLVQVLELGLPVRVVLPHPLLGA